MHLSEFLANQENVSVLSTHFSKSDYFRIDLTPQNDELHHFDFKNPKKFEDYLNQKALQNNSKIAYGGYLERRLIYQHNQIFNNPAVRERNIHIGLDLWLPAKSEIFCAMEGRLHSFQNNNNPGDYGPTIILEHEWKHKKYYTLYGHLSKTSLENLKLGTFYEKGALIATLGDASENGFYAPHLHFQIIENIGHYIGDYPGVCSEDDLNFYKTNCPNPNLLLKLDS